MRSSEGAETEDFGIMSAREAMWLVMENTCDDDTSCCAEAKRRVRQILTEAGDVEGLRECSGRSRLPTPIPLASIEGITKRRVQTSYRSSEMRPIVCGRLRDGTMVQFWSPAPRKRVVLAFKDDHMYPANHQPGLRILITAKQRTWIRKAFEEFQESDAKS